MQLVGCVHLQCPLRILSSVLPASSHHPPHTNPQSCKSWFSSLGGASEIWDFLAKFFTGEEAESHSHTLTFLCEESQAERIYLSCPWAVLPRRRASAGKVKLFLLFSPVCPNSCVFVFVLLPWYARTSALETWTSTRKGSLVWGDCLRCFPGSTRPQWEVLKMFMGHGGVALSYICLLVASQMHETLPWSLGPWGWIPHSSPEGTFVCVWMPDCWERDTASDVFLSHVADVTHCTLFFFFLLHQPGQPWAWIALFLLLSQVTQELIDTV